MLSYSIPLTFIPATAMPGAPWQREEKAQRISAVRGSTEEVAGPQPPLGEMRRRLLTSACRTDSWERWVVELGTGRVGPEEEPLCSTAGVPRLPTHLLSSQALQGPGTMAGCPWVSYIGASLGWRGGQVGLHWGRREGGDGRGGEKEGRASGKGRE